MPRDIQVVTRPVRQITMNTGRPWSEFRSAYERAVPHFDHSEATGLAQSGSGWDAIRRLSEATAADGFVNFFVFDPSPVMHLNGLAGNAVTYLVGNIIKAEQGFRRHPGCFLYVPLRVVIASDDAGEAQLTIDHPADLLSAYGDPVLDSVAKEFCRTLVVLFSELDVPIPPELAHVS